MASKEKSRYQTKRLLEEIKNQKGRGTELISVYIPPDRPIHEVMSYLRNEQSESSNIKSKSTRKNVTSALESIMSRLRTFKKPPENGLIIFTGHVSVGGDQTTQKSYVLEPPEPVSSFLYRCDSSFYLEPIEGMLDEKEIFGLLVIDRSEGTVGLLRGNRVEELKNVQSLVPSKHGKGGQSARRFERLIEIAAHEFFTKFGDIANDTFLSIEGLKGILVGGPGATKDFFVDKEYLHHELQKKVMDTFDTGYTNEYGLRELVENAKDALDEMGLMEEKKLIQRFMKELRKSDGGLSVYGERETKRALRLGAVDTLLLSDDIRKVKTKVKCPSCGYETKETMKEEPEEMSCPECGYNLEIESEDLVEEFYNIADQFGTEVKLISGDSEEGDLLDRAFGGIAGILRFPV